MSAAYKQDFKIYLEEAIGQENAAVAFSALEEPASVSVRMNPFKPVQTEGAADRVPWCRDGFFLERRPVFTLDPNFHAGAYYVQDSSSMFVGHIFRRLIGKVPKKDGRPVRVLDLCAAPGGKTTDLAASLRAETGNGFVLVSNEVMAQRASVLASNVAVWGDPCVVVTSDDPSRFASMSGWFDVILADVPCSGEGMFRKDMQAREQWSVDNVRLCQGRQRRIIADIWPALSEGGLLIYSTCTFNRYENDDNADWIALTLGAEPVFPLHAGPSLVSDGEMKGAIRTRYGFSLVPGLVRGEGQYCTALVKTSAARETAGKGMKARPVTLKDGIVQSVGEMFSAEMEIVSKDGLIKAVPLPILQDLACIESHLHVLSSGCAAGELKKNTLVPDPDLALSVLFRKDSFPVAELPYSQAITYLQGNQLVLKDMPAGYLTVCFGNLPLGFVKNIGNRCNNLYPRGRRIRMDVGKINLTT